MEVIKKMDIDLDELIAESIFKDNKYRLEVGLEPDMEVMDNVNANNLNALLEVTEEFIEVNSKMIDEICLLLMGKISEQKEISKIA